MDFQEARLLVVASVPAVFAVLAVATPTPSALALVVIIIIAATPVRSGVNGRRGYNHGPGNIHRLRRDIHRWGRIDGCGLGVDHARYPDANIDIYMCLGRGSDGQHRAAKRSNDCQSFHIFLKASRA
ncbi:hypothetical protein RM96_29480 [Cupriavidus sp. IDO]|nr:hypothetical protein RM96_29480 [Cupriavidus sp. IDO]